jgi:hypothetical protein
MGVTMATIEPVIMGCTDKKTEKGGTFYPNTGHEGTWVFLVGGNRMNAIGFDGLLHEAAVGYG